MSTEEIWSVYIIYCDDNSLYTGIAKDVEKRFFEHLLDSKKGAKYFRGRNPLLVVYQEDKLTKSQALKKEYLLKKLPTSKKWQLI